MATMPVASSRPIGTTPMVPESFLRPFPTRDLAHLAAHSNGMCHRSGKSSTPTMSTIRDRPDVYGASGASDGERLGDK